MQQEQVKAHEYQSSKLPHKEIYNSLYENKQNENTKKTKLSHSRSERRESLKTEPEERFKSRNPD